MDQDALMLSPEQAVKAICLDFRGYPAQTMLFGQILRTLFSDSLTYKRVADPPALWVSEGDRGKMRWLEGETLVAFMCRLTSNTPWTPDALARLCGVVFQTACRVATHPEGHWGIAVHLQMAGFSCRQCGRCCRELDYRDGITAADVERLAALGRKDILDWVGISRDSAGNPVYRMWVEPGTNCKAVRCPFLKPGRSSDQSRCAIHDVKPEVCRNYPVSRKHATMTGCPGFD